jgi:hypothetical protein
MRRGIRVMQAFVCQLFDKHFHDVQAEVYLNPCIILRLPNQLRGRNALNNQKRHPLCTHLRCQLLVPSVIREHISEAQCDASADCVEAVSTA